MEYEFKCHFTYFDRNAAVELRRSVSCSFINSKQLDFEANIVVPKIQGATKNFARTEISVG